MPSKANPVAKIETVEVESEDSRRIAALEAEGRRYPFSPVFRETIALLKKQAKTATATQVTVTMPLDQAEKLYGLLGQITRHSGFDPIFQSLNNAPFVLRRVRPKLHFTGENLLTAEY